MAPRRTTGEELAWQSRSTLWFHAVYQQVQIAASYAAILADNLFRIAGVPWRLQVLLAMYAYTSLAMLIPCHVQLFLPRVPFAVHQALLYGGFFVGACVVNLVGRIGLALPGAPDSLAVACTCFIAVLIVGLLVLWGFLVGRYGGAQQPSSGGTATSSTAAGNSMPKHCPRRWKRYRRHVVVEPGPVC